MNDLDSCLEAVAYPGFQHGRGRGAIGHEEGVGCGEGVSPPHWGMGLGRGSGEGAVPLPRKCLVFWG